MPKLRPGQKLVTRRGLSLKLRKAIQILALNQPDLDQLIRSELKDNPFLDEKETNYETSKIESLQNLEYTPDYLSTGTSEGGYSLEEQLGAKTGLNEYLMGQLSLMSLKPRVLELAESILSNLNEQGFTREPHEKTAQVGGFSFLDLKSALKVIEDLEPTGVGAENIWQSLEWQAKKTFANDVLLLDLIALLQNSYGSLEELNEQSIKELSSALMLSPQQMKVEIKKLISLNLYPAANFQEDNAVILPDIVFQERGRQIEVQVNNKMVPEVVINKDLFARLPEKDKTPEWVQLYEDALNLVKSLDYRNNSLLKVGAAIARKQTGFFNKGPKHISPMSLSDIADLVDLHISTVSRIVSRKYCQTKYGVLSLKVFFPRKLKSHEGKLLGAADLKKAIQKIIDNENPLFPLSDQKISSILESEGFNIKRRTVAKYRKLLHIPSQIKRKAKDTTNSGI